MTLLDQLNDRQREAVTATEGPLLVLAGAGSGKTRVLTYRIAHLVQDLGVPPRHVLAFTFTNKAAGEMKERLAHLLGGSPRDLWVGTFHATGVRILRLKGSAIGVDPGFSIYDTDDQETLVRRILKDLEMTDRDLTPRTVRSAISSAKNALLTPAEFEERAESFREQKIARVFAEYRTRLKAANALDFDDLIGETIRLLRGTPRRAGDVRGPVPLRAGGRVPGHQRGPGPAHRPPGLGPPQPVRGGGRRPVHLRLARGRRGQHPLLRAHLSPAPGWSAWSRTTAPPRSSSTRPTRW